MRGKVGVMVDKWGVMGITPAYAGKSFSEFEKKDIPKDHPRVCGEKANCKSFVKYPQGSPPRMRGKVLSYSETSPLQGITPAYAGKSGFAMVSGVSVEDHPRVCGEKRKSGIIYVYS